MLKERYTVGDFLPLVGVLGVVVGVSVGVAVFFDLSVVRGMQVFMGVFFLVFGLFKVVRLKRFAEAYQMYDLLAGRSVVYAYLYPFVELALGVAYLRGVGGDVIHWITLVVVGISAVGVYNKLRKREKVMCACLGAVFQVPMTWVTLAEDVLMFVMAGYMLVV